MDVALAMLIVQCQILSFRGLDTQVRKRHLLGGINRQVA